jgi:hypothetical protein
MKSNCAGFVVMALAVGLAPQSAGAFDLPKIGMPEMLGGGSKDPPQAPGATADCPVIVLEDGAQMIRSPANADAANVHHQLSIKSTARECVVEGDRLIIKVGVEGDAMLGPVGSPGSYGGAIRVALRRTKDDSIIQSKNYRVNAAIPSGAARADFRFLAEPITAPATAKPLDDYEIIIGFSNGAADVAEASPHKKTKKGRR